MLDKNIRERAALRCIVATETGLSPFSAEVKRIVGRRIADARTNDIQAEQNRREVLATEMASLPAGRC